MVDTCKVSEEGADGSSTRSLKFKKISFQQPEAELFVGRLSQIDGCLTHQREGDLTLVEKLFAASKRKEPIVVLHCSENKGMNLSERKEVLALSKWYEDMME